jgi:hypothetical protein
MPDDPNDYANYLPISGHNIPFVGPVAHWQCRSVQIPVEDDAALTESTLQQSTGGES